MSRPIAEGLFKTSPSPCLIGGRRKVDGRIVFPLPAGPDGEQYDPVDLKTQGTLWSFTVQRFRPKSPPYTGLDTDQTFKPYPLGYIELDGQVIVESRIAVEDFGSLRIGQPMGLILQPFGRDADGAETVTFAFKPIPETRLGAAA